ncbi:MAG: hypothetical protein AAF629_28495 [Chloroflexota bacterium]
MSKFLNWLDSVKGFVPLSGLILVVISLIAQFVPLLSFLTVGQWLLHLGVILGIGGLLVADAL